MASIDIHDARTQLSRLLARVERGEEIVITRAGGPVARLVRYERSAPQRSPGRGRGLITVGPDFDGPLPDDLQSAFGMQDG